MSKLYSLEIVNAPLREKGKPNLMAHFESLTVALAWKDSIDENSPRTVEYRVWKEEGNYRTVLLDYSEGNQHLRDPKEDKALVDRILKEEEATA